MARDPIPTWHSVIVATRKDSRFLLVQETRFEQTWALPGGLAETGETLIDAARREALEETGLTVVLDGIVRVEHTPLDQNAHVQIVFVAHPAADTPPKRQPDEHTLRARWVTLVEMNALPLRSPKYRAICEYLAAGGPVYPLSLLELRDAPFPINVDL